MHYSGTKLNAYQAYQNGSTSYQQGHYQQAIEELLISENLFRQFDSKGHPFIHPLPNGISGLASTLALAGRCYQNLGNYRMAARCYETSFINAKFEKMLPFRKFSKDTNEQLRTCYERMKDLLPQERLDEILRSDPAVDTLYRFPFSLDEDTALIARLYELAPKHYKSYRDLYMRAKTKDSSIRKQEKKSDEASMSRLSLTIWGVLIIIWAVYGMFVINALVKR